MSVPHTRHRKPDASQLGQMVGSGFFLVATVLFTTILSIAFLTVLAIRLSIVESNIYRCASFSKEESSVE